MKKTISVSLLAGLLLLGATERSNASTIFYTTEAAYLSAIAPYTNIITEGFESSEWDASRGTSGTAFVNSQGVNWTGSGMIRTGVGWAQNGDYGVFDNNEGSYPTGDQPPAGYSPDIITITSGSKIHGVGGWFANSTASAVDIMFNSTLAGSFGVVWDFQFIGMVSAEGFHTLTISSQEGQQFGYTGYDWGADDFIIASQPVPEPATMMLLGTGLTSLAALRSRRRRK